MAYLRHGEYGKLFFDEENHQIPNDRIQARERSWSGSNALYQNFK